MPMTCSRNLSKFFRQMRSQREARRAGLFTLVHSRLMMRKTAVPGRLPGWQFLLVTIACIAHRRLHFRPNLAAQGVLRASRMTQMEPCGGTRNRSSICGIGEAENQALSDIAQQQACL